MKKKNTPIEHQVKNINIHFTKLNIQASHECIKMCSILKSNKN